MIDPYYGDAKLEAFDWIVEARSQWLLSFGDGTQELLSELDYATLESFIPQLVNERNDKTQAALATSLGNFFARSAHEQALKWARAHIDEIWANRKDPDYQPPWEKEQWTT